MNSSYADTADDDAVIIDPESTVDDYAVNPVNAMRRVVSTADGTLALGLRADAESWEIVGADELMARLRDLKAKIVEYDYCDDDRREFKDVRADARKLANAVRASIRDKKELSFERAESQRRELEDLVNEIVAEIDRDLEISDMRAREARRAPLDASLADLRVHRPELESVTLDDLLDPTWLNRSASERRSIEALNMRAEALADALKESLCPEWSLRELVQGLIDAEWQPLKALGAYRAEMAAREEARLLAEARERELKLAQAARDNVRTVTVSVAKDDYDALIAALDASGVSYEIIA